MLVHDSVEIRDPKKAFEILTSRDGAAAFRDIGEYTDYVAEGWDIRVAYPSAFGQTRVTMKPGNQRMTFEGIGPMGILFFGSWKHVGTHMILEQRVWGVPWFGRALVQRRVTRALEDLKKACQL